MSWEKLLSDRAVTPLPATKQELDNLRSIVTRSLRDVTAPGLSVDARFVMAYDAARTLSLMVVRAAGYRPRSAGAHYHTFAALEAGGRGLRGDLGILRWLPDQTQRFGVRSRRRSH
jgi:hypothetical protein